MTEHEAPGKPVSSLAYEGGDRCLNWCFVRGVLAALAFAFVSIAFGEWCLIHILELLPKAYGWGPTVMFTMRVTHILGTAAVQGWICALIWKRVHALSDRRVTWAGIVVIALGFAPMLIRALGISIYVLPVAWLVFMESQLWMSKILHSGRWKEWVGKASPEATQRAFRGEEK